MKHHELSAYRQLLEAKQTELSVAVRDRSGITVERSADANDEVVYTEARDLSMKDLEGKTQQLRLVNDALKRIKEGVYGTCLACEEAIETKRLHAVPWAECCTKCQHLVDTHKMDRPDIPVRPKANATALRPKAIPHAADGALDRLAEARVHRGFYIGNIPTQ